MDGILSIPPVGYANYEQFRRYNGNFSKRVRSVDC